MEGPPSNALPDEWRILPPLPAAVVAGAACSGEPLDAFFSPQGVRPTGRSVCEGCQVVTPCLDYALLYRVKGVWGGMTERERDREKKRRKETDGNESR